MAVLGIDEVLRRVREDGLLTHLGQRGIGGSGRRRRGFAAGTGVHVVSEGGAFIEADGPAGLGKRKGVQTKLLAEWQPESDAQEFVVIDPGEYYVVRSVEGLKTPLDLMPMVYPRGTLFRVGLLLMTSKATRDMKGRWRLGLRI